MKITVKERVKKVRELKDLGYSFTDIGKMLGITRQRAHQIYHTKI